MTTYEYDGDRLVRSVTVREPEWDSVERALVVAAKRKRAEMGSHGVPMHEATDPANAGTWVINEFPRVDYVKLAMNERRDRYYAQYPDSKKEQSAHIWYVKGRDE